MRKLIVAVAAAVIAAASAATGALAEELKNIRVGFCAKTVTGAASPFAIATKMGWYAKDGIKVELVPLPGSTDCVKFVATKQIDYALPSIEPLAIIRGQGVKAKNFYTAYQSNIYGLKVPDDSAVKSAADLKGKKIGVASMASGGLIIARALVAQQGLDPDRDVSIIVVGEAAQAAALARSHQVDVLSLYDTQFALVENAGVKLRTLDYPTISKFPSNGFVALEDTIKEHRAEAIALCRGYAQGQVFAIANPEAAIRMLYEIYPYTKPTGKDEATAIRDDVRALKARIPNWLLEPAGVTKWGENSETNYANYVDWLVKNGVLKQKVPVSDLITNELIDEINKFDKAAVEKLAKEYRPS